MAVDSPSGDELTEVSDSYLEKLAERDQSHADGAAAGPEITETRTPAEYDRALRAIVDALDGSQPGSRRPVNESDIARGVTALPDRFADRLDGDGLADVRDAARAGEWGEAVDILLAGLVQAGTTVTVSERNELRSLLEAMGMPTDPVDALNVG